MPLIFLALVLVVVLAVIPLSIPLSIIQRYRLGTARRLARGWVAAVNACGVAVSAALFLGGAAISSAWIPKAFTYSAAGFAGGCALGLVGLALIRWEPAPHTLHYTPNRWLVLAITLIVTVRLAFGVWRAWHAWHAWHAGSGEESWLAAARVADSLAAGAVVLGYYFTFWAGVWIRVRQHQQERGAR